MGKITQEKSIERIFSIVDAAKYLLIQKSTLYKYTSQGKIAHYKPNNKTIYFKKADLDNWAFKNRSSSNDEIEAKAEAYLSKKKEVKSE